MPTCFVIQPFDNGPFDKRFDDVYIHAIQSAGLEAYRVDRDPSVGIPIEGIEKGIRNSSVCLADITTDNPNVWYELGFAFATGRPVVMICSRDRISTKYPFDIQHRTVISYTTESSSDFEKLKQDISDRIKAMVDGPEAIRQIAEADQIAPTHGLSQGELMVLATLAGDSALPGTGTTLYQLKESSERYGLTAIGFTLAFRRLLSKQFIKLEKDWDEYRNEEYIIARVTDSGWDWIESNESLFILKKNLSDSFDDSIPF